MKRMNLVLMIMLASALILPALAQINQSSQGPVTQPKQGDQRGRRGQKGAKIFRKMDKNNDRQVSRDEWNRKPKAFDRLDRNSDGILSGDELKKQAKKTRTQPNPTQPSTF